MKHWLAAAGICALATLVSMAFIDHPLAELVYNKHVSRLVAEINRIPRVITIAAAIAICAGGIFVLVPGSLQHRAQAVARTVASVCIAYLLVSLVLKPAFGRSGPLTWMWTGTDKFYFLGGGDGDYFFPSSHAALLMAAAASLWLLAPSRRPITAPAGLLLCMALVVLNIHFLSDVIVGGFIGAGVARLMAKLWPIADIRPSPAF